MSRRAVYKVPLSRAVHSPHIKQTHNSIDPPSPT